MPFRFEDLQVWQKALELNDQVNIAAKNFPKDELYALVNQMKRAADSVVLNIAEGSTEQTKAVFKVFLNYSLRSAIEVVSCLFIAKRRNYLSEEQFKLIYNEYEILVKMITALRNSI